MGYCYSVKEGSGVCRNKVESTPDKVVAGLVREMELKDQLIPSSYIDLRESIGQGNYYTVM